MSSELTSILQAIDRGDAQAAADLLPLLYDELRRLAESRMANESPEHTLQATALVHEAYLRVIGPDHNDEARWQSRAHFFAAAAEAMRRILVDHARAKGARKRGGDARRLTLDPNLVSLADTPPEILDLHEAVEKLDAEDPLKASLVKLRFFGGLTQAQAASVLGLPTTTAERHWTYARAWLYRELSREKES